MKSIQGIANTAFLGFFGSHIFATLVVDSQAILPKSLIPGSLQDLLSWYVKLFNDPLMGQAKDLLWFQSLVALELTFQLPFFVWACSELYNTKPEQKSYSRSFQYACLIYGGHASTSMVPILSTLMTNPKASGSEKAMIVSLYLPYLLFPAGLLWFATKSPDADNEKKSS